MKGKSFFPWLILSLISINLNGQPIEHLYNWHPQAHAAWKVQANFPSGYVIIGDKYFNAPNTNIYVQGFDESGTSLWLRTHPSGLTSLQSFWKSFTATNSGQFFTVSAGEKSGHKAYTLLVNTDGNKIWDRVSYLSDGIEFGGVCNGNGNQGGWVAAGGSNSGNVAVVKFDYSGYLQWSVILPYSGYAWSITQAAGGGYFVASGPHRLTKINNVGNVLWSTNFSLPPDPVNVSYTYTEFEEVIDLPNGDGEVITGSAFSNSYSAVYTARLSSSGDVLWVTIHNPVNTGDPGTPVSWINNAVHDVPNGLVTSWRNGPVSAGGAMYYQRQYINNGELVNGTYNLNNTIRVREAFMIYAHNKYVIGGTAGDLTAAYSYIKDQLPIPGRVRSNQENYSLPTAKSNLINGKRQINQLNGKPIFDYPVGSRMFNAQLRVFPNPSTGQITVGGKIEPGAVLRVTDFMGRLILERQIMQGDDLINLNLTNQGKGIYTVEMLSKNQVVTKKVVLQ